MMLCRFFDGVTADGIVGPKNAVALPELCNLRGPDFEPFRCREIERVRVLAMEVLWVRLRRTFDVETLLASMVR